MDIRKRFPLAGVEQKRELAAILSAGAGELGRSRGEDGARGRDTLKDRREAIYPLIGKHRGRIVDSPGESLLAMFDSALDAVQCAMEIQENLRARNEAAPEAGRILCRIGVHIGPVTEEEGEVRGEGVDVAALLDGLAEAGDICISGAAYDRLGGALKAESQYIGEHRVPNVAGPVRAYRVKTRPAKNTDNAGRGGLLPYLEKRLDIVKVVLTALSVLVGIGALWNSYFRGGSPTAGVAPVKRAALPLPDKPSIAVLPFENMTNDPGQEYFADGFTEQIITSLSKIPALFVISRTSTFSYKGKPVRVQQVSEELGVRYVLEGSIQKSGNRIRINVQLIDATSGQHVWAQSYDRALKGIFTLQDEVILKIASAMSVNLTAGEQARAWAEGTKNLEAYLNVMQGREYLLKGSRESVALARRSAEEAIALDPGYAEAYALLGASHMGEVWHRSSRPEESIAKAIEWTQKALSITGSLADARSRLGVLYTWSGRYDEGIAEAERGVELNPNSATANYFLAGVLRYAGRSKDAIPVMHKALRLAPIAPDIYVQNLALLYFQTGDCGEAIATCEKGLNRDPDNLNTHAIMAAIYGYCDREAEARKQAAEVLRIDPKFTVESYTKVIPYKNPADRERTAEGLRKAGLP